MKIELSSEEIDLIRYTLLNFGSANSLALNHKLSLREHGYWTDDSKETWYCEHHRRQATFLFQNPTADPILNPPQHHCDPDLGGITLPCSCIKLDRPLITKDGIKPI